jgi:hypothetical protein
MAKAEQTTMEGFEQESIRTIENQADKVKVDLGAIKAAKDDLKNHRSKIAELMHANEAKVAKDPETGDLVYIRGEYEIRVHASETVKVSIADEEQGE